MTMNKIEKGAVGGTILATGIFLKIAELGMSVAEVVLNGAENLADHFVKAPKIGIGKSLFGSLKSYTGKASVRLIKDGKGILR